MNGTLLDTNILIDVMRVDAEWHQWSCDAMLAAMTRGPICINPIIYAELAPGFSSAAELDRAFSDPNVERRDLPWEAAYIAGHAFVAYRTRGGMSRAPMPDFYIGAHAVAEKLNVLTRDPKRYNDYFPELTIISPPSA